MERPLAHASPMRGLNGEGEVMSTNLWKKGGHGQPAAGCARGNAAIGMPACFLPAQGHGHMACPMVVLHSIPAQCLSTQTQDST
jgi:hypothetical protein